MGRNEHASSQACAFPRYSCGPIRAARRTTRPWRGRLPREAGGAIAVPRGSSSSCPASQASCTLEPPPDRASLVSILVAESFVQQLLLAADETLLQDHEEDDDDDQGGKAPEKNRDAGDEEDRTEIHRVPAPAIKPVPNQYGRFSEWSDRGARGLEHAPGPYDHGHTCRE